MATTKAPGRTEDRLGPLSEFVGRPYWQHCYPPVMASDPRLVAAAAAAGPPAFLASGTGEGLAAVFGPALARSGVLVKRGHFVKNWKARFFVLTEDWL